MVDFVTIERSLLFFTEALQGSAKPFVITTNEPSVNSSQGNYADVTLPSTIETYGDFDHDRQIYLWLVLQQLGFSQFDTLTFDFNTAARLFPSLSADSRSFGHRASEYEKLFACFSFTAFAARLFEILEAARVERLLLAKFPGSQKLRVVAQQHFELQFQTVVDENTSVFSLTRLQASMRGLVPLPSALRASSHALYSQHSSVYDSVAVLIKWYEHITESWSQQEHQPDLTENFETSLETRQRMARLEEWQEELEDLNQQHMGAELLLSSGEESVVDEANEMDGSIREVGEDLTRNRDRLQRMIDVEKSLLRLPIRTNQKSTAKFNYHEWDYLNSVFLPNHCTVYETLCTTTANAKSESLLNEIKPYLSSVRKQFEQLKPTGLRRLKHVLDGDEIDIDSLLTCRIDRRARHSSDERFFSRLTRANRDVSAVLLVDLSASTDDIVEEDTDEDSDQSREVKPQDLRDPFFDDDDDPYLHGSLDFGPLKSQFEDQKRILDIEREAVLLLATALEDLGDLYAIFGFSGYGRENVEIEVAKEFGQALNFQVVNGLANLKPMRSTRMGPAIRHACWHLGQTGTALKILLVISDGFPQDHDYGPDRSSHEYGIQDTAKALQEARLEGIQTFCVTVDRSGHDYLRRMCPNNRYLVIEETKQLPDALRKVYQQLSGN